ncbi:basic salivary proline-rich protein 1-like isoform X2 [Accipiter gentilis]|uniref:basic salivary proline-rich protein 1-like isoform X2 n=1 Tax=Astur gentilis TaxID=8957 RepID=UPI00210F72B7|nr:basic salivary proline-rich protein 1-like isoform X2 [Accipiter gentilis]
MSSGLVSNRGSVVGKGRGSWEGLRCLGSQIIPHPLPSIQSPEPDPKLGRNPGIPDPHPGRTQKSKTPTWEGPRILGPPPGKDPEVPDPNPGKTQKSRTPIWEGPSSPGPPPGKDPEFWDPHLGRTQKSRTPTQDGPGCPGRPPGKDPEVPDPHPGWTQKSQTPTREGPGCPGPPPRKDPEIRDPHPGRSPVSGTTLPYQHPNPTAAASERTPPPPSPSAPSPILGDTGHPPGRSRGEAANTNVRPLLPRFNCPGAGGGKYPQKGQIPWGGSANTPRGGK